MFCPCAMCDLRLAYLRAVIVHGESDERIKTAEHWEKQRNS